MKSGWLGATIFGLAALGFMATSAFVPWYEWSLQDGRDILKERSDLWGAPAFVEGTPYRSVVTSLEDQQVIDFWVVIYGVLLLLGVILVVSPLYRSLSRRWGLWRALLAAGGGGVMLGIGIALLVGFPVWIAERAISSSGVQSTRIVTATLERVNVEGLLILFLGVVLEIAAAIWAFQAHSPSTGPTGR